MTTYRQIFIDIDSGNTLNGIGGGILINKQKFNYGTEIPIEFVFCSNGQTVDISDIKAARVSIDNDYTDSTEPMTRTDITDIDLTETAFGIVRATIKTGTEKFKKVVDGNSSSRAYLEFRGYDETGNNTRCYIITIDCLGYIDPDGGDTIPIPETSATKEFVEAKLSGTTEELNNMKSAISTNSEDIATLSSSLSNTNSEVATISGEVASLTTTTEEFSTQLESLSSTVGTNAESINNLNEKISGLTNYELPIATADTLGGIRVGSGLTITEDGILNADIQSTGDGTTTITTNAEWGKISGTLSNQTDLQEELNTFSTNLSAISSNLSDTQTNLSTHTTNSAIHITAEERTNWNAKSTFSGNYNDLTNSPDLTIYATKEELTPISENLDTLSTTVTELSTAISGNTSGETGETTTNTELPIILASSRLSSDTDTFVTLLEEDAGKILYNDTVEEKRFTGAYTNSYSIACEADNFYILLPQTQLESNEEVISTYIR